LRRLRSNELGDGIAGLVGLHLATFTKLLDEGLGPGLREGREGQTGVDVRLRRRSAP